jgi:hypothetical protein
MTSRWATFLGLILSTVITIGVKILFVRLNIGKIKKYSRKNDIGDLNSDEHGKVRKVIIKYSKKNKIESIRKVYKK